MFYNKRQICIRKLFDNLLLLKVVLVCVALLLSVVALSTNFVVANATQIREISIENQNVEIMDINIYLKILGTTKENTIKISNCHIDKLLLEGMCINVPNQEAVQIDKGSNIAINTSGNSEVVGKSALILLDSKIYFGNNSKIRFAGELFCDRKALMSFAPSSEIMFISKQDAIKLKPGNVDCSSGKAGFFIGKIPKRSEISGDIEVSLVSQDKAVQRKFTLRRDEASFGLSLPKNKYTISYDIKSSEADKFAFENQIVDIKDRVCSKTAHKAEITPLKIVGLKVTNPSEYGTPNGKIEFSATGGIGKYKYFCKGTALDKGVFTDLAAGNYTIGVVDSSNKKVSQTVKLKQPLSTKLNCVLCGETELKKNSNGDFEITVDDTSKTIEFKLQLSDDRASAVINDGRKIVLKKYGVIKIPIKVTADDRVGMYGIAIRRKPPQPKIYDVPKDWVNGDFLFRISPNTDNLESYVSLNGGSYSKTSSLKISKSGIHEISAYYEADEVKSGEVKSYIKIDNEKPKINGVVIAKLYSKSKEAQILSEETPTQFVCKIDASDAYSGIASVKAELENGKTAQAYLSDGEYILPLGEEYKGRILITAVDKCGNKSETFVSESINCDLQNPKIIGTVFPTQTNSDGCIEIVLDEDISENLGKLYYNVNNGASILINNEQAKIEHNRIFIDIPLQGGKYKLFVPKESISDIAGNCMSDDECYSFSVKNVKKPIKYKSNNVSNSVSNTDETSEIRLENNIIENECSQIATVSVMADQLMPKEFLTQEIAKNNDISHKISEENILRWLERTVYLIPKTQVAITFLNFHSMIVPLHSQLSAVVYFSEML